MPVSFLKRLRLSCLILLNVTVTELRNACLREAPPAEASCGGQDFVTVTQIPGLSSFFEGNEFVIKDFLEKKQTDKFVFIVTCMNWMST
jgi:hypothetical protein